MAYIQLPRHGGPDRLAEFSTLRCGTIYFAVVFGVGFILGLIRIIWAIPRFGLRTAELLEMPIMLLVTIASARWTVRRLAFDTTSQRLLMGCIALGLVLAAEFSFVLWIRGVSIRQYLATRDPVASTVYYMMLGLFAIMPLFVARR